jgi:hypothetical protein
MKIPSKTVIRKYIKSFPFERYNPKKVKWSELLAWIETEVPDNIDPEVIIDEEWQYDDCIVNFNIEYSVEENNPNFNKQLIKYNKYLSKLKE